MRCNYSTKRCGPLRVTVDGCQVSEGIGSPRTDVGVGIAGIIVQIQRERPNLCTIVRVASNIGHTPAGKRSQAMVNIM